LAGIEEIANSRVRLTIASLISARPRTLGELAETTGISVQGVLKHLGKLSQGGLVKTRNLPRGKHLNARKLYYIEGRRVADYSEGDMIVATLGPDEPVEAVEPEDPGRELDGLAQDVILLRRRVRELASRLKRMSEEMTENEARIAGLIEGLMLTPEEKQIAYLIFGDDRPETARRIMKEHYGCRDPESAVRELTSKLRSAGA
jgi:predicted transcriptional regulator